MICIKTYKYFVFLFCIIVGTSQGAALVCLDANAPISASSGNIAVPVQVIADTATQYVRINFILGPWTSPADATRRGSQNLTWFETFDEIVNGLTSRGVKIYGLIGAEAVKSSSGLNTEQYVNDYVSNFVSIVDHFKDRVRVYESFNEPNDWAGGTSAQVPPYWFARMLEQIYRSVRLEGGRAADPAWQVTLVSGPLFSHDMDTVAPYFSQVYSEGINNLGWAALKTQYGTYPLDGIGYHIYVSQGTTEAAAIKGKISENLNAIWGVIQNYEGNKTPKKLWVSEMGWSSDYVGGEAGQALNMQTSFDYLLPDTRIALVSWFCLTDFPGAGYGIFKMGSFRESDKKAAWQTFHAIATNARRSPALLFLY